MELGWPPRLLWGRPCTTAHPPSPPPGAGEGGSPPSFRRCCRQPASEKEKGNVLFLFKAALAAPLPGGGTRGRLTARFPQCPWPKTKSHVTGGAGSPSWRLPAAAGLSPAGRAAGPKPGPGPDRRFCEVPRRTPRGCTWRWSGARSATPRAAASPAPSASRAATSSSSTAATPRGTGGPEGTGRGGTGHPLPPLSRRPGLRGAAPPHFAPRCGRWAAPPPLPSGPGVGDTHDTTLCVCPVPPPPFPAVQPLSRGGGLWVWGGGTVLPLPGPLWGCLLGGGCPTRAGRAGPTTHCLK